MSISCELTFRWPMGHRILGYEGAGEKCRNIHGHNWTAEVSLANDSGKLEFGYVKERLGSWIDQHWDHSFAVAADDPFLEYLRLNDLKHHELRHPPTTENLAAHLAVVAGELFPALINYVHIQEGFNNGATWRNEAWRYPGQHTVTLADVNRVL
jgi:6-pyruvoyltetrahydropterin/6-carboxytetrahydropterin synthase